MGKQDRQLTRGRGLLNKSTDQVKGERQHRGSEGQRDELNELPARFRGLQVLMGATSRLRAAVESAIGRYGDHVASRDGGLGGASGTPSGRLAAWKGRELGA